MKHSKLTKSKSSPAPLKIGLVLDDGLDKPDGVQQYVLDVGAWLSEQGHEVHYLVGQTTRADIPNIHSLSRNIAVSSNGNRLTIPLFARRAELKAFLHTHKFDVLHVQTPYSPMMGEQLIMLAPKRTAIIGTFHILPNSWLIQRGTALLGWWSQRSLRRFDSMLSVSAAAQSFAEQTFAVNSQVVPNMVDYERFHTAKPLKPYADKVPTILFLGRLVPRKGCQTLLEAVAELSRQINVPPFRVVICGRGPLEAKLRQFVAENGIENLVEFTGFVDEADKPRYYASADIAVFPSSGGESFGIVLLEAMASGKAAVLAGDNPGYRSVMQPKPELLFEPKNAGMLAQHIRELLTNHTERKALARWGARYTKDFDVHTVGPQLLNVYQQALRTKHKL